MRTFRYFRQVAVVTQEKPCKLLSGLLRSQGKESNYSQNGKIRQTGPPNIRVVSNRYVQYVPLDVNIIFTPLSSYPRQTPANSHLITDYPLYEDFTNLTASTISVCC